MHLTSTRLVTPDGILPGTMEIAEGRIVGIREWERAREGEAVDHLDCGNAVVMPGLIDAHVHVNEPGRTHWEGFDTIGQAAAAGGITTIVDMPLNSDPVTTSAGAVEAKCAAARTEMRVDYGLWGGLVPSSVGRLPGLLEAGVLGVKAFLCPSGLDDFPPVTEGDLRQALPILAEANVPLLVHAESPHRLAVPKGDPRSYRDYLDSRPPAAEHEAVRLLIGLARAFGARVHVVHVSSRRTADLIGEAVTEGVPISGETCPHYLMFASDEIADGATLFKCAPPIRAAADREGLWQALHDGRLALIASDHSPCPPDLKCLEAGSFQDAWGGISSLELLLPAVWAAAVGRGVTLVQLAEWLARAPAVLAGLDRQKGALLPGYDADLVVWDPDAEWAVDPAALHHRHPTTPYARHTVRGRVLRTFLRGREVYASGVVTDAKRGVWLPRRGP